jgi:hypothetical protein
MRAKGIRVELQKGLQLPENICEVGDDIMHLDLSYMGFTGT